MYFVIFNYNAGSHYVIVVGVDENLLIKEAADHMKIDL